MAFGTEAILCRNRFTLTGLVLAKRIRASSGIHSTKHHTPQKPSRSLCFLHFCTFTAATAPGFCCTQKPSCFVNDSSGLFLRPGRPDCPFSFSAKSSGSRPLPLTFVALSEVSYSIRGLLGWFDRLKQHPKRAFTHTALLSS